MATQLVEIKNPVGVNTSLNSADLPPSVWSNVSNVSFKDGKSRKAQGYSQVFGTTPSDILYLTNNVDAGQLYWYEATPTKIYRTEGTSHIDISRPATPYAATESRGIS